MRLVVGLGNPGAQYTFTRHNIGALVLAKAADRWAVSWSKDDHARWGSGRLGLVAVIVATPLVWMNQSGPVVQALLDHHGISPQDLVVVHDDLDLPLGRLRIKRSGGAGGHKGILSIIDALATQEFCRLKIGIGIPTPGEDPADYVLSPFSRDELARVETILERAAEALECLLTEGLDAAMNRFNVRQVIE